MPHSRTARTLTTCHAPCVLRIAHPVMQRHPQARPSAVTTTIPIPLPNSRASKSCALTRLQMCLVLYSSNAASVAVASSSLQVPMSPFIGKSTANAALSRAPFYALQLTPSTKHIRPGFSRDWVVEPADIAAVVAPEPTLSASPVATQTPGKPWHSCAHAMVRQRTMITETGAVLPDVQCTATMASYKSADSGDGLLRLVWDMSLQRARSTHCAG